MGTTHGPISPAIIYLIGAAVISLIAVLGMTDRTAKSLR